VARFFYALRPDAQAAGALGRLAAGLAARLGGRALDAHDIHLTLVFVGERPATEAPKLAGLMTGLVPSAQPLALVRLGSFGRGLLWAGPAHAPDGSDTLADRPGTPAGRPGAPADATTIASPDWPLALAAELQRRLRTAGIGFDERTLRLHATLVRGAGNRLRRTPADVAPAASPAGAPALRTAFDAFAHALPVVPTGWTLVLGRSDGDSTPQRRYRWETPAPNASPPSCAQAAPGPAAVTGSSRNRHKLSS
jgi:2'-5' RNA ligase